MAAAHGFVAKGAAYVGEGFVVEVNAYKNITRLLPVGYSVDLELMRDLDVVVHVPTDPVSPEIQVTYDMDAVD